MNDKKTVAISSLQISSRPVFLKKGCFNLLKKEECECKILHKFLQNGGVQAHLEEDIIINHCSHKHIVSSDAKLATKFTYDFQRKTGDKNSVLLKVEQFGSLIFNIFHGGESFSGLSREQSDLFEYLRSTIKINDVFVFLFSEDFLIESPVVASSGLERGDGLMGDVKKSTIN